MQVESNLQAGIFTACIIGIHDSAKEMKFTAKAVATFGEGTRHGSEKITHSYNEVSENLENA